MVERFVETSGTISITTGTRDVVGSGTLFSGQDHAGSTLIAYPSTPGTAPIVVGTIAEGSPQGEYSSNLALTLVNLYRGATLTNVSYELVDGPALANGAVQAEIFARYAAHLEQNMGLVSNADDEVDLARTPNNTLIIDEETSTIQQYRNGVLTPVLTIASSWNPMGAYSGGTTYAKNDMVQSGNYVFVSNVNANTNNAPNTAPASTAFWTYYPTASLQPVLDALGVHHFIISESQPSGGHDNDVWFVIV